MPKCYLGIKNKAILGFDKFEIFTMNENWLNCFDAKEYIKDSINEENFNIASIGFDNALNRINKGKKLLKLQEFSYSHFVDYLSLHIRDNITWATNISFRDTKQKNLTDIFIELDLFITPRKLRIDYKEVTPKIPLPNLLADTEHNIILLGQPGAGKTTSVKKIFLEVLLKVENVYKTFNFPLVVKLKNIAFNQSDNGLILFKEILNTLGIFYSFENNIDEHAQEKILIHIFKDFIERLNVLIILEGFDEITELKAKNEVIKNLDLITNSMMNSRFILTSRSADYNIHLENSSEYEICPLNEFQITDFIKNWLKDNEKSQLLESQLKNSPYWDTTMRPLTLAHLCALFEKNNSIPEKPKSVYKKIIHLLLEDWSNQRLVVRKSKYSKFEVDRKMDFLSRFGYELSVEYYRSSFDKAVLELIYSSICTDFNLPKGESNDVVKEIESHNGLILQTGADIYEFAHKSLLEYLVADYLVKLPTIIRDDEILLKLPNELAIWISISSNPSTTFFLLIHGVLKEECTNINFLQPFLSRLVLEKPDFDTSPLYAVTYVYLLNVIAQRVFNLNKDITLEDEYDDYYDNLTEHSNENDQDDVDYEMHDENFSVIESYQNEQKNLLECADIILSYKDDSTFRKSILELKKIYKVSDVAIRDSSPQSELKRWGKPFFLKQLASVYKTPSQPLKLPDNLYLIGEFNRIRN